MLGRNHIIVGAATVALAAAETGFIQPHLLAGRLALNSAGSLLVFGLAAGAAGALLPDIDHPGSSATRQVWGNGLINSFIGRGFRAALGGHRGLTHSAFALLAVAAVCGCAPLGPAAPGWPGLFPGWADAGTAFTLGYLSHIAADMLTRDGVRFWFPLSGASVGLAPRRLRFEAGGAAEYAAVVLLVALTLWRWYSRLA